MTCLISNRQNSRILVQCPADVRAQFTNAPQSTFEGDWLRLYPSPAGGWRKFREYDEQPGFRFSSVGVMVESFLAKKRYEANIDSNNIYLFVILSRLVQISNSTALSNQFSPIVIRDYCTPNNQDLINALSTNSEAFSTRQGKILITEESNIVTSGTLPISIPGGFRFAFYEASLGE